MSIARMMTRYMEEAAADTSTAGGAVDTTAATTTDAAAAPASLLAGGATEPVLSPAEFIPEKHRVIKEDGTFDLEASSRKMADAYTGLEKRMGTGDAPPKTAADYKVAVPDAMKEAFDPATDEGLQGFLGKAHAAGMTQGQIDLVMSQYFEMAPRLAGGAVALDQQACAAELKKAWATEADFNRNVHNAYTGANVAAQKAGIDIQAVLASPIANNPMFMRLMAAIGPEFNEDAGAGNPAPTRVENVEDLMRSEAYTNPLHKDHLTVSKQVQKEFARRYGTEAAA